VNSCFHPGDELVDDLHLTLTAIDTHELASLARR
jgi:hypothetical protein